MAEHTNLEQCVRDERWGAFWFFRPIFVGPREQEMLWQVWDFENEWYPKTSVSKLLVYGAPSQLAAAQQALTGDATHE